MGLIVVCPATDAPLLPHQCTRLAQRASLGLARTGGGNEDHSGDIFIVSSPPAITCRRPLMKANARRPATT